VKDCPFRDDELETTCRCDPESDHFRCQGQNGKCIPPSWLCDGVADCPNGEDEIEGNCPSEDYQCLGVNNTTSGVYNSYSTSRTKIPSSWKCDGEQDCRKGDDEKFCEPVAYPRTKCNLEVEFACRESSSCVEKKMICDGVKDCPKGDDELNCNNQVDTGVIPTRINFGYFGAVQPLASSAFQPVQVNTVQVHPTTGAPQVNPAHASHVSAAAHGLAAAIRTLTTF
jgi:hypothetical protein